MGDGAAAQIAHTESLFREVNERIAEAVEGSDAQDVRFVCECGDPACTEGVRTTLDTYEEVRADATTFLLAEGHVDPVVEAVVHEGSGHAVVEKRHPAAAAVARERDPRR